MCTQWFGACINASGSSAVDQYNCVTARDANCANNTIEALNSGTALRSNSLISPSSSSSSSQTLSQVVSSTPVSSGDVRGSSSSRISGGVIAGIVIGAVAGISILGLLVFYSLRKRKRRTAPPKIGTKTHKDSGSDEKQVALTTAEEISHKPELHGDYRKPELQGYSQYRQQSTELPATWHHNQSAVTPPAELHAESLAYALPPFSSEDQVLTEHLPGTETQALHAMQDSGPNLPGPQPHAEASDAIKTKPRVP